jgi:hypothetical protein
VAPGSGLGALEYVQHFSAGCFAARNFDTLGGMQDNIDHLFEPWVFESLNGL